MSKKFNLPYFNIKKEESHFILRRFLCRKFLPSIRKRFPCHYLVSQDVRQYLKFVKTFSKTHPYFLKFDINKYFPSINHHILLNQLRLNYEEQTGNPISRRLKQSLKKELPDFLKQAPFLNQGLAVGNELSHILAGIFLFKLDLNLKTPFLRFCDDYLVLCKTKAEQEELLIKIINPILNELNLSLNIEKLKSGRFHQDKVEFLGFEFYAGYIRISKEKIEEFKKRIKKLTHLTCQKPIPAIIKLLNNKILGFGHYYKFAQSKQVFEKLDGFIRARLRRYIQRNKDGRDKQGNLILTSSSLQSMGLKSLEDIYQKCWQKNQSKFGKKRRKKAKTGKSARNTSWFKLEEIAFKYQQKLILNQLKELTDLVRKLERRLGKIEKKL